ncbi:MAG TPA: biotin-dependent carboxyltransferase family protein [Synergistales bacterium]|nr:biotin-dependent carboxyltransferase family protein [Synergistota bacterium]HPJ47716.1 biotin-dependent carboxyltransferase family protein [Synergistales bacterium]
MERDGLSVEIISPGVLSTVQDLGRYGFQAFGMPVAGALDRYSLMVGNLVVGNDLRSAGLEITISGPELLFRSERLVCITGGDLSPKINDRDVPVWQGLMLHEGDVLSFGGARNRGARSWICIGGGIDTPPVMGSRSTYLRGGLGGHEGRRLERGDILPLGAPDIFSRRGEGFVVPRELRQNYIERPVIRVIPDPREALIAPEGVECFYTSSYRIGPDSDRMGYRLQGPLIRHKESPDMISDAVPWGAIQVPGNGLPIIMMADCQTTGGYPKIAGVISADLGLLSMMLPGDHLSFRRCAVTEAADASRALKGDLERVRVLLADHRSRPGAPSLGIPADNGAMLLKFGGEIFDVTWRII